jgi:hypothetical protein
MFSCFHFWCIREWNSCNNISSSIKMQNSLLAKIGLVAKDLFFQWWNLYMQFMKRISCEIPIFDLKMSCSKKCFGKQDNWITRLPWCPSIRVILITWFFLFPLIRIGNFNKYLHEHGFKWQFNKLLPNSHVHMGAIFW